MWYKSAIAILVDEAWKDNIQEDILRYLDAPIDIQNQPQYQTPEFKSALEKAYTARETVLVTKLLNDPNLLRNPYNCYIPEKMKKSKELEDAKIKGWQNLVEFDPAEYNVMPPEWRKLPETIDSLIRGCVKQLKKAPWNFDNEFTVYINREVGSLLKNSPEILQARDDGWRTKILETPFSYILGTPEIKEKYKNVAKESFIKYMRIISCLELIKKYETLLVIYNIVKDSDDEVTRAWDKGRARAMKDLYDKIKNTPSIYFAYISSEHLHPDLHEIFYKKIPEDLKFEIHEEARRRIQKDPSEFLLILNTLYKHTKDSSLTQTLRRELIKPLFYEIKKDPQFYYIINNAKKTIHPDLISDVEQIARHLKLPMIRPGGVNELV